MVFLGVYRAIYDYAPQSEEELEIAEGDLLFVLEKSTEDAWWKAKKKAASDEEDEPEGLIPNNYIEEAQPVHKAKALYDYTQQTDEELSFRDEAQLDVYDTSDPDWTLVGLNGQYGFAPAIYIEALPAGGAAPAAPPAPSLPTRPQAPAADEPLPGEADYPDPGMAPTPSPEPSTNNPAAALAGIIAQRTGGAEPSPATERALASPPLPSRPQQYTPEESEEEEAPSLPQRPMSQALASPPSQPRQIASPPPPRMPDPIDTAPSPPHNRNVHSPRLAVDDLPQSPGGFHLYNISEMVSHMGRNKKMPTTLGINVAKGIISISPEKSRDGPTNEWTAEKLTHYSIEGKHVFVELIRPSKSVDFHAGAKDTAQEIVSQLGELAGAVRQEGLREVLAASAGTGAGGQKRGQMLYEFMAQGDDEVTVAVGDEVIVLDDTKSDEWWMVRRLKNGKTGVVPSSYVEITGTVALASESVTGLNAARSTVEQNRLEEQRLAKDAAKKDRRKSEAQGLSLPERGSSLSGDKRESRRSSGKDQAKSKPNQGRIRTWTDRTGTFKVEAEFIGLRDGKIHLHKQNGVKIAVPVSKMSVEDLEYVENATGTSLDDDKPLSDIKRRSTQKRKDDDRRNGARASPAGATVQRKDDGYDWFDFFLQCGVNPQICERYAGAFSRDEMGPENLPDVNEKLLRTLGLKEGDILRVMKHLNEKYGRDGAAATNGERGESGQEGGLFSGPGGALRNNTRKGRPAPAVQTNDTVDESAFKPKDEAPAADTKATPLASAPARQPANGFDDDAWDVKPARTATPTQATAAAPAPVAEPPKPQPKLNDDLSLLALPLQPDVTGARPAPAPAPAPAAAPTPEPAAQPAQSAPQQPQGADQAIFDKIAALRPNPTGFQQPQPTGTSYQRPAPPAQQPTGGALGMPPPPRAGSAPAMNAQQSAFGPPPLQPQLTGYQQSMPTGYQQQQLSPSGQPMQQQQFQQFQPQQTGYGGFQQNGMMPQPTGVQAMQQNYPALQPQATGFQPQSQFGQSQFGGGVPPLPTPGYQQALVNGAQTGSPFADPPRQPYQPTPSGLGQNMFSAQQTGYQPQQQQTGFQQPQPTFNIAQPTGAMNGSFGQAPPQLPPQQTGGVFGPSQPAMQPLVPQKTGPPPPVRFGTGAKPLVPQRTGRAELSRASKSLLPFNVVCFGDGYADFKCSSAESVWFLSRSMIVVCTSGLAWGNGERLVCRCDIEMEVGERMGGMVYILCNRKGQIARMCMLSLLPFDMPMTTGAEGSVR